MFALYLQKRVSQTNCVLLLLLASWTRRLEVCDLNVFLEVIVLVVGLLHFVTSSFCLALGLFASLLFLEPAFLKR